MVPVLWGSKVLPKVGGTVLVEHWVLSLLVLSLLHGMLQQRRHLAGIRACQLEDSRLVAGVVKGRGSGYHH